MPRGSTDRNAATRKAFLAAFAITGNIAAAAQAAGTSRRNHIYWLEHAKGYKAEFEEAKEKAIESLEAEARRRALEGEIEYVVHEGHLVWVNVDKDGRVVQPGKASVDYVPLIKRKRSDTLMIFLLKALRPEMYRERSSVDVTTGGAPVKMFLNVDTDKV